MIRSPSLKKYLLIPFVLLVLIVVSSHSHHDKIAKFAARYGEQSAATRFTRSQFIDEDFNYTKVEFKPTRPTIKATGEELKPTVLILSTVAGNSGYGRDRSFDDFYTTLQSLYKEDEKHSISLAFLINNYEEFVKVEHYLTTNVTIYDVPAIEKITLISAPFIEALQGFNRDERHNDRVQRLRRRLIARARNFLLYHGLQNEQYTLFIDADITHFDHPQKIIPTFIESKKDVIVPRVVRGGNPDYDKNSWRGHRTKPNQEQLDKMDDGQWEQWDYVPHDVKGKIYHFEDYVKNSNGERELHKDDFEYAFPLDSVGGAVLFAKSVIYKQGVIFPTSYIIGTSWDRLEGYDGIETEGLCYLAKPLGYLCWGLPNVVAYHSEH
ncbi:Anp1-domain-containing protein [Scheffersomyces xylosifermentans]|uniref:Anp1-domain-containing protein n=1 Tax=Scheffersomyces xylosifermentans TaxID=1304137 RepID=UPI00315CFC99